MPELPEVEVLVRHLAPLLTGKTVRTVEVRRPKIVAPTSPAELTSALANARFVSVMRRAKFLVFELRGSRRETVHLLGHLGMTGRMYLLPAGAAEPKHVAVALGFGRLKFIFEDTRYFGRFTLDTRALASLGPEPLGDEFTAGYFATALRRSTQPIKVKLLDQGLVAGIGNIYASEALFRARIAPQLSARRLTSGQVQALWQAIREVLQEAIDWGSTVPLDFAGTAARDRLFYFGRSPEAPDYYERGLRVYDREGRPCPVCGTPIRRIVQAARSTFYCPACQSRKKPIC